MAATQVLIPFQSFPDIDGDPLEDGYIFIGLAGLDPVSNPQPNVYWDAANTVPAAQPIRTAGGFPWRNGAPAQIYLPTGTEYSILVRNKNGSLVYSSLREFGSLYNLLDLLTGLYQRTFATTADAKAAVQTVGATIRTNSYVAPTPPRANTGGAQYLVMSAAQYGATPDGYGDLPTDDGKVLKLIDSPNTLNFGCDNTGAADCQANITELQKRPAFDVEDGTYLCAGIKIAGDNKAVTFKGEPVLKANANGVILFWQTGNYASHKGVFRTDVNGKTNVWGMAIAPADLTQTTTVTDTNFNVMPAVLGQPELTELIVLQNGPEVGGNQSGCYYNRIGNSHGRGALRCVWLKNPSNLTGATPNRNWFYDCRFGTQGGISSNTGIQIDAGETNTFVNMCFEGIGSDGRSGPNAVQTAVIVKQASTGGSDNNFNKFYSGHCEANVRDIDNDNAFTEFYGFGFQDVKALWTKLPQIVLGGSSSATNQRALGFRQIDVNQTEYKGMDLFDTGYSFQPYPLTVANMIHAGGPAVTSVAGYQSYFQSLGKYVEWGFRVKFRAANNNPILITLPLPANVAFYENNAIVQPMKFVSTVSNNSSAYVLMVGSFNSAGLSLVLYPPTTWDTTGNNNEIHVTGLRYRRV
jgi:hypothetical protein